MDVKTMIKNMPIPNTSNSDELTMYVIELKQYLNAIVNKLEEYSQAIQNDLVKQGSELQAKIEEQGDTIKSAIEAQTKDLSARITTAHNLAVTANNTANTIYNKKVYRFSQVFGALDRNRYQLQLVDIYNTGGVD